MEDDWYSFYTNIYPVIDYLWYSSSKKRNSTIDSTVVCRFLFELRCRSYGVNEDVG